MNQEEKSGTEILSSILSEMNVESGFSISVLTDKEGLPIAWASDTASDPERQSAVVAFVQKTAVQVSKQLDMAEAEEIAFSWEDGQHFICRPFKIDGNGFILAVLISSRNQSYRRAPHTAIVNIQKMWKKYWETSLWV
jgi:predicted regulator of Ras-like GTPase activity (Roadblock/LC7/MglB family)